MGGMKKLVHAENQFKSGTGENRIGGFGSLGHRSAFDPCAQRFGKAVAQTVVGDDVEGVGTGSGIGQGGAGSKRRFSPDGHVADGKSEDGGGVGGLGQASSLYRGDVFPDGVDFVDGGARSDQYAMNLSDFGEREGSEQRRFHKRRAAAREQHDEQSLAGGVANKFAGGFAGEETVIVRFRMAALEALEAQAAFAGSGGSGDHTAEFFLV